MKKYAPLSFHGSKDGVTVKLFDVERGEPFSIEVDEAPWLWTTTDDPALGEARTLMSGAPLKRLRFQDYEAAYQFVQSYGESLSSVYGHPKLANAIYGDLHRMRGFERVYAEVEHYRVTDFDVETEVANDFPDPVKADMPINMITHYDRQRKQFTAMTTCVVDRERIWKRFPGAKVDFYRTEAEMLIAFAEVVRNSDVIAGWNIDKFDVAYVLNRAKRICGHSVFRSFSPFSWVSEREFTDDFGEKNVTFTIKGVYALDLAVAYKKFVLKPQISYSLDNISKVELKAGKLKHESGIPGHLLYRTDPTAGLEYNMVDVQRCTQIDVKKGLFALVVQIGNVTRSNLEDSMFQTRMWTNLLYWQMSEKGIYFQLRPEKKMPRSIVGGYVADPIRGMHEWIVSVDLTSSYPSHIIALNMSPETKGPMIPGVTPERWLNEDLSHLIPPGHCMAANGQCFRTDVEGELARVSKVVKTSRKADKKVMMRYKDQAEHMPEGPEKEDVISLRNLWDVRQNGWKVTGNSEYGAIANAGFIFSDPDVAEAITMSGQLTVRRMGEDLGRFTALNGTRGRQLKELEKELAEVEARIAALGS